LHEVQGDNETRSEPYLNTVSESRSGRRRNSPKTKPPGQAGLGL